MFEKANIDALFAELESEWKGTAEFEQLSRDAHLGIALDDSGRSLQNKVDERVAALITKHRP